MAPSAEVELRQSSVAVRDEMTVKDLLGQVEKIQEAMKLVMKPDEHYGIIPGTNKPTLYKPGAEKLCLLFRLAPEYDTAESYDGDHYTVRATCRLVHIGTGAFVGGGEALCTTRETKYAYRGSGRVCPNCGEAAIIKGKAEFGGGWLCFKKKGGCGSKWADGDTVIEALSDERVDNPDLADTYNTVLKMACKRALVAAVLNATAASDIFTQDLEDISAKTEAARVPAQPTTVAELRAVLDDAAATDPKLWSAKTVIANCKRRFSPKINSLEDLTEEEAIQVIEGAKEWIGNHELTAPDDEIYPVEGEVVDDSDTVPWPSDTAA